MGEPFEVLDFLGNKTGGTHDRKLTHQDGTWHRSIHVHPINPERESIILQQRDPSKDVCPGLIDTAAAGHYNPGETFEQALREVYEEIGLKLKLRRYHQVAITGDNVPEAMDGKLIRVLSPHIQIYERPLGLNAAGEITRPGVINHELQDVAFLVSDATIHNLVMAPGEVAKVLEFDCLQLRRLMLGKIKSLRNKEGLALEDGKVVPCRKSWTKADFWPTGDNYFAKVADIALSIFGGEELFPGI